jgi:hypothetical protein
MTDVRHKIIGKRSSWKKEKIVLIFVEIFEKEKKKKIPLGYYYKYMTQDVICILIPQMLKIWNCWISFSKINK